MVFPQVDKHHTWGLEKEDLLPVEVERSSQSAGQLSEIRVHDSGHEEGDAACGIDGSQMWGPWRSESEADRGGQMPD